jgi:Ca-activated chloride channel family protein
MFRFANPQYLFLLLIIPALAAYYFWRGRRLTGQMKFSTLRHVKRVPTTLRQFLHRQLYWVRLVMLSLIILGLARPQSGARQEEIITEGIDIMMVLDVSTSGRQHLHAGGRLQTEEPPGSGENGCQRIY